MAQTVLITGASSGIGLELARLFAKSGFDLVLVARSGDRLERLGQELEKTYSVRVTSIKLDLSLPSSAKSLYGILGKQKLIIDILINNAGFGSIGPFVSQDLAQIREMMQLNMVTLTELCWLFGWQMAKRRQGKILNLASTASFFPGPLMAIYYATKAYVLSLSESLHEEMKESGISVTALCPGPTDTGFQKRAQMQHSKLFSSQIMSAEKVAKIGYRALMKNKPMVVAGFRNKLYSIGGRVVPHSISAPLVRKSHEM